MQRAEYSPGKKIENLIPLTGVLRWGCSWYSFLYVHNNVIRALLHEPAKSTDPWASGVVQISTLWLQLSLSLFLSVCATCLQRLLLCGDKILVAGLRQHARETLFWMSFSIKRNFVIIISLVEWLFSPFTSPWGQKQDLLQVFPAFIKSHETVWL